MSSSDSDAELFYDAEDVSPSSHGRHQDEEPATLGMTLGAEEREDGVREREAAARRARDMEIRRQKLEAMRNQLSDENPRERSRGQHNSGQGESQGQFRENEMCFGGNTNDCNKSDSGVNIAMETPLNVAMETMNIRTDSGLEKHGIVGSELDVNIDDMRAVTEVDNVNMSDGHDKKVCCKVVSEIVSGVDVTSLRRTHHDGDSGAILHSKQPDIVKSVLPFHKVEPVAPPRRKKKKQAPPPPQMRRDDRNEALVSITPPGVEAVKDMPLPSTSSDCSDLDSTPNFSLTEDIDRSKVTITDDPEQSLDITAATQGSRMVTAVEDSSCRADAGHDPVQGDTKGQHDDDPLMTQTNRPESHDSGDDVVGSSSTGEHQVPLMMQRPRSNSGSRFLSDKEILEQVKVVNLDTGEELPLSLAEEKLPTCVNPLSLHIMRRTKEYSRLLEFLHNMQSERRPCDCRRRTAHSVDRSTTVVLRRSVLSRTGSDSSLHKRHLGSDEEEQHDRRSDFGARTLNTVTLAKRKGVKLRRMLGKTVNKIKHVADEVFKGEDNSASDDDDLTDGRRMIKIKAASVHKGPYDFDLLVPVQDLSGEHMGAVWTMKFSPCGRLLATGGQDKMLRVWVLKEACSYFIDMRHKYMYTQGGVSRVSPAPSQDSINSQSDATSDTSATEAHREGREEEEDAHAPFMKKPFCVYKGHTGDLLDISWSKNYFVLSSSMDKTVRLWHASRRECLCCFQHIDFVTAIAFHPKDDRYFLSGSLDGKLRLWSIPDKKVALWNEVGGQSKLITAVNFCMNGKFAVVGTYDGLCVFYSTEQLKYYTQIHVRSTRGKNARGRKITGLEPYPGEDKLLVTSNDSRVRIYDLRDLTLTCKYKGGANNSSQIKASFSHDGKYIICGSEDQAVYIWRTQHDVTAGRRDRNSYWESIKAHLAVVTVAIFSPSPHLIIRPQFDSVESNATEEKPDASSLDSQGEALVSADFSGAIKVFINKFKPSPD